MLYILEKISIKEKIKFIYIKSITEYFNFCPIIFTISRNIKYEKMEDNIIILFRKDLLKLEDYIYIYKECINRIKNLHKYRIIHNNLLIENFQYKKKDNKIIIKIWNYRESTILYRDLSIEEKKK
jgi:hypothetical protein